MSVRRVLLLGCVVVGIAACSDDDNDATPVTTDAPATTPPDDDTTTTEPPATASPVTTSPATAVPDATAPVTTEPAEQSDPLEADTTLGRVQGADSDIDGVRAFLTIPYAEPPTGENRWRPPQPHQGWDGPLDASEPGASCPQPSEGLLAEATPTPPSDEDCLTLSVWSPADADDLPVMVWFHGGALTSGSAHQPLYVGDDLAANGVVVVNVNYRLGALGFLAADVLADAGDDSDESAPGNYGLADQTLALEWVRDNIAGFGGDPANVTIFGESAGGFSVCGHLASPLSQGLFHKAIIQSGGGCKRTFVATPDEAYAAGERYMDSVGCADAECLRDLTVDEVIAGSLSPVAFVTDGVRFTDPAYDQAVDGTLPDIPVLIGANADEATLFTIGLDEPTDEQLPGLIASPMLDAEDITDPEAVLALYPADQFETNLERFQAFASDIAFICPALELAGVAPEAYAYHFTYVADSAMAFLGATHGAELVPLFAHPEGIAVLEPGLDGASRAVSDQMQEAWVSFAENGRPGDEWPAYGDAGAVMLIAEEFELTDEIRGGRCDELSELTAPQG